MTAHLNIEVIIFNQVARFCRNLLKNNSDICSTEDLKLNVITRQEHNISRKDLSDNALKVLYRLSNAGYDAYLVGGGVRDILLGQEPKDFDIATNATPEQIKKLFRNCRLIGRRFRLAHILFGRDVIEVATFRGHHKEEDDEKSEKKNISAQSKEGMLLRDNVYGTVEEDAQRRDFTINAMYYNIADYSIHDYANGIEDLNNKIVRLIGDPETRYREDPVRMLRAVRFAAKLDMTICDKTAEPMVELSSLLQDIPAARLFEESLKLLQAGKGLDTYYMLRKFNLFQQLFPALTPYLTEEGNSSTEQMIELVLRSTDKRINSGKRVNPAFMFAAMLWYPLTVKAQEIQDENPKYDHYESIMEASNIILDIQVKSTAIPRRLTATIRDVWQLQLRLPRRNGKRAFVLIDQQKFRAAYDFLEMRGAVEGGETKALADWWTEFQDAPAPHRNNMIQALHGGRSTGTRKRRSPYRKKKRTNNDS
ncbi:poly(A) polymerase [Aliivibrio wodanis]|uniref:Poly(A) polymerase I n=1 Tax=Aliivibrio wodanis TaxID=80852 RepID=A0A090IMM0_9GAMM|nr:poly(A) polymerase [Aliivibrio wodanis]